MPTDASPQQGPLARPSLGKRCRSVLIALALVLIPAGLLWPLMARGDEEETLVEQFVADYAAAFTTGNPFLLAPYDPGWQVFGALLHSSWFDHVQKSAVALRDRSLEDGQTAGTKLLSFVKVQEDLLDNGLVTRGVSRIEIELELKEGRLRVLRHRALPPAGADDYYQSNDPRTWGPEHSAAEASLFSGLDLLREGDTHNASRLVDLALDAVAEGSLPEFLLNPVYFEGTTYYAASMLASKQGDSVLATAHLERALQIHPDFPAALNLLAQLRFSDKAYTVAQQLWRRSLELKPDQEGLYDLVLWLDRSLSEKDAPTQEKLLGLIDLPPTQAIQVLSPLVKRRNRDPGLVTLLAKAYWADGDLEKGLETLQNSGKVGKDAETTWLAARFQLRLGNTAEAQQLFENVWNMDPNYRDTLAALVSLYGSAGKFAEALARLNAMDPRNPRAGVLHAVAALYNLMDGRFLDAVTQLERATAARLPSKIRAEVAVMQQHIGNQGR